MIPFFMKVRMTIAIRKILVDGEREFTAIITLTARSKVFGRLLGRSLTTSPLQMTVAPRESGEWRIIGIDENIIP